MGREDNVVPRYVGPSALARRYKVARTTISNWIRRYPVDAARLPTPAPDAFVDGRGVWLETTVPAWDVWVEAHAAQRPVPGARPGPRLNTNRERIRATLEERIRSGVYAPGEPIPTTRVLAEEFGVQDMTVNRATTQLKAQGLIALVGRRLIVCAPETEDGA